MNQLLSEVEINHLPEKSTIASIALERLGIWPGISLLVLLYLFISTWLRVAKQSITVDEAMNYAQFLRGSFGHIFLATYDANNQVLQSVLSWLSIHWFGVSEYHLRIPSLVACGIFFWAVFRISSLLFARRPLHLLSTVLLAGNPYVLDFFTVARGYGLALAFFSLAVCEVFLVSSHSEPIRRRMLRIGVWTALCVSANLAFLFPIIGLFSALTAERYLRVKRNGAMATFIEPASDLLRFTFGPFLVLSFCILVMPMHTATKADFYFGAPSWSVTIDSLLSPSLFHNLKAPVLKSSPHLFWWIYSELDAIIIPALVACVAAFAAVSIGQRRRQNPLLMVSSVAVTGTIAVLWLAHALFQVKFPIMRTGLYFLFLLPLSLLCVLHSSLGKFQIVFRSVCYPVLLYFAIAYIPQWNARAVSEWRFDASTRDMAKSIELIRSYSGKNSLKVGGSWQFAESLNFYRAKNGYSHWQPIVRGKPTDPADIYLFTREDKPVIDTLKLKVLVHDPISGATLAGPVILCP